MHLAPPKSSAETGTSPTGATPTAPQRKRQFKAWYAENHGDWNEKRRDRYATDPSYRAKVLERNRKHRNEKKQEDQKQREEQRAAQKYIPKPGFKTFTSKIDGKELRLVTIGAYAQALGVSVQAVRLWERNGVIPKPGSTRASGKSGKSPGQRVYTKAEIEENRKRLIAQGRISDTPEVSTEEERVHPYVREVIYPNGRVRKEKFYTIGVLAHAVHLTVVTLSHHERKGYLPRTPFRGSSVKRRLYTKPMIDVVLAAFESRPAGIRGKKAWKVFYSEVLTGWTKLGVVGAKLKQRIRRRPKSEAEPEPVSATG